MFTTENEFLYLNKCMDLGVAIEMMIYFLYEWFQLNL